MHCAKSMDTCLEASTTYVPHVLYWERGRERKERWEKEIDKEKV